MGRYPKEFTKEEWDSFTPEQKEEHHKKKKREWFEANKEHTTIMHRKYDAEHREKRCEYAAQRYRRMREALKVVEGARLQTTT